MPVPGRFHSWGCFSVNHPVVCKYVGLVPHAVGIRKISYDPAQGTPAANVRGGLSLVTTAPAPMSHPSPMHRTDSQSRCGRALPNRGPFSPSLQFPVPFSLREAADGRLSLSSHSARTCSCLRLLPRHRPVQRS